MIKQYSFSEMQDFVNENGWDCLEGCEYNVPCGDIGYNDVSKWCEYCQLGLCTTMAWYDETDYTYNGEYDHE